MEEGGGETSTFPFEVWHYRYLEGIGENIDLEFVDTCQCGDYHFTIDRSEKDALLHVPNAGLTSGKRWARPRRPTASRAGWKPGHGPMGAIAAVQAVRPHRAGRQDLRSAAGQVQGPGSLHLRAQAALMGPVFPFDVRTDFVKVTESTVLVPITLQMKNRDITFVTKDGVAKGVVNILGKVTTLTHKTVQTFEDTVEVSSRPSCWKSPRPPVGLLEGAAPAARTLPPGYRHQGREQSGPHGLLRPQPRGAGPTTTKSWPPPR
jgi:hypothetical protein